MTDSNDALRFELKLVAWETQLESIEHWLRMHRAAFRQAYPDRWVNNVYFDTHEYDALGSNIRGDCERSKLRYRWYGSNESVGAGTLEIKQKRDKLGWKLRYDIRESPSRPRGDWAGIRRSLRAQLPLDGRLWLDAYPVPVIINRYSRRYLVSADGVVRATLDSRQSVWDQGHGRSPNMKRPTLLPPTLVVEIKAEESHRAEVVELLQGLPPRVGRNSKYVSAVRSTLP